MADSIEFKSLVDGDVDNLTNIGTVQGNVFVVSKQAVSGVLSAMQRPDIKEVTKLVTVYVTSQRFARQIKMQVPANLSIQTLQHSVIQLFGFPRSVTIHELMLDLRIDYYLAFKRSELRVGESLSQLKITDGAELDLRIRISIYDHFEAKATPTAFDAPCAPSPRD